MGDGQAAIGQRMWGLKACTCTRTRHRGGSPFLFLRTRLLHLAHALPGDSAEPSKAGSSPTETPRAPAQLGQRQEAEQIGGSDT